MPHHLFISSKTFMEIPEERLLPTLDCGINNNAQYGE